MDYEVFEDRTTLDTWRVEAQTFNGEMYVATFYGCNAENLANEYANFKNGDL